MDSVFMNMNAGMIMGTICSDLRKFNDKERDICIEFDVELKRYVKPEKAFKVTCVSFGAQAELILKTKTKGDTIVVLGYLGDVDIGHGTTRYGHHKFRVTSVHFQFGSMINFSGKILTQPEFRKSRVEFFAGTYRRHETVPIQPCKMKIVCADKLANVMWAFRGKKNVGDSIFVMGSLIEERGSLCILAKRIELLLPEPVKDTIFKKKGQNEQAKAGNHAINNSGGENTGDSANNSIDGREGGERPGTNTENVTVPAVESNKNTSGSNGKRKHNTVAKSAD